VLGATCPTALTAAVTTSSIVSQTCAPARVSASTLEDAVPLLLEMMAPAWPIRFPEGAVRRVVLLQYGDDPVVEPGEVMVRVLIPKDYGEAWAREHMTTMMEIRRELAERLPEASRLEVMPDDPDVPYDHKPRSWCRRFGTE